MFNFALICYWVPEDSHHLVDVQGLLGGDEAVAEPGDRHHLVHGQGLLGVAEAVAAPGNPDGAELDSSV